MNEVIVKTKGDNKGYIDDLIKFLEKAKLNGATHYKMSWSGDPHWAFKWFEAYRIKSEYEIKEEKRKELQRQLDELDNKL